MPSTVSFNIRDHSDEYSAFTVNIPTLTEAGFDTSVTAQTAIQVALAALTTGNIANKVVSSKTLITDERPANPYAQRETGLRLFYQDEVTFQKYHVTVPCPDLLLVASGGTDDVDLSGVAVVNALVNAMEPFIVSPDGNPVSFYKGTIVGRRN